MDFTLLFFAFAVLLSIYFYLVRNYDYWRLQNVPCADGAIPGFGHVLPLLLLRVNFSTFISQLYAKMNKRSMYGCYLMQTPTILIRDPELVKVVLQSEFSSFCNNIHQIHQDLDPIMSRNPFFSRDELWRKTRLLLSNNFSGKKMRFIFANTSRVCRQFVDYVDRRVAGGSAEFESRDLLGRVSAEVVANSAFGVDGQSFEDKPAYDSFTSVAGRFFAPTSSNAIRQAVRSFLPKLADNIGVKLVPSELDGFIRLHLGAFIKSTTFSNRVSSDCYQFSVEKVDADENMVTAQATSLLFDGYEAYTNVLSFMVYRLAENPTVQDKARKEVREVLEQFDNELTYEAVKKMDYLDLVIQETLRMNPVFGDLSRVCTKEIKLRGYDELECHLKPGDMVLISAESMQMDEEFWPEPERFDPERFSPANKAERSRYTFLGFSEGARICPGKRMGMMVVKYVAAVVLQRYALEMAERSKGPLKLSANSFASIVEGGLWVKFKPLRFS